MFFLLFFDTVKNIIIKTLTFKFKRKLLLLSEKNKKNYKSVGYARANHNEFEYLEEQINRLKKEGCNIVFSEFLGLEEEIKPELNRAISNLNKGDELIMTQLDRAFLNRKKCLATINEFNNKGIRLRTLTGFIAANNSFKKNSSVFHVLYELDNLDEKSLSERKKEQILRRKLSGKNLGGRPKISPLKESLVARLRNEGYSYRSIRTQTGIALSTIRRIILEEESK